jgi:chromosome segregation ATPase
VRQSVEEFEIKIEELEAEVNDLQVEVEALKQKTEAVDHDATEVKALRRLAQACLDDARQVGSTYLGQLTTVQAITEALEHGVIQFMKVK